VLDELDLHITAVILGDGQRLFGPELGLGPSEGIELTPTRLIETREVTHIRYRVNGRAALVLDNRGKE
jgi:hypothetical protein